MADPFPQNIVHVSRNDINADRTHHVTPDQVAAIEAVENQAISGDFLTVSGNQTVVGLKEFNQATFNEVSGTLMTSHAFYFNNGGYLVPDNDGKNLFFVNKDGVTSQITNN